jgi:hypothetical protein
MRKFLGLAFVTLALSTCGGGSSGSQSVCQQIGTALCTKACSCRDGAGCGISEGGATLDFPSESDCRGFYVTVACSQGDKVAYNDAAACLTMVQAATCDSTGAEGAVAYPTSTACETPKQP